MKSSRSTKRNIGDVHEKYSDKENVASKKATRRIGQQNLKAAGECRNLSAGENNVILPLQAAKVSCQKLAERMTCSPVTKGDAVEGSQQLDSYKKIKLQLFPINKSTRQRLEKDGCNPHQELTLSAQKKISSVIKHLNTKWSSSSLGLGELLLFPYDINAKNIASQKRWSSKDTNVSAGEVYAAIGSPAIFRLRYDWFSDLKLKAFEVPDISPPSGMHSQSRGIKRIFAAAMDTANDKVEGTKLKNEEFIKLNCKNEHANVIENQNMASNIPVDHMVDEIRKQNVPSKMENPWSDILTTLSIGGLFSEASLPGKISNSENKSDLQPIQLVSDISIGGLLSDVSLQGKISSEMKQENSVELQPPPFSSYFSTGSFPSEASSQGMISDSNFNLASKGTSGLNETSVCGHHIESKFSWDSNLTNLSIGGLLSEVSLLEKLKKHDQRSEDKPISQPDSLDTFVAARMNSHPEISKSSSHELQSSILDAEETCHAFPVRKVSSGNENATTSSGTAGPGKCHEYTSSKSFRIPSSSNAAEVLLQCTTQSMIAQDQSSQQPKTTLFSRLDSSLGLKGIKWEDSLGPFDLGLPVLPPVNGGESVSLSEFIK